MRQNATMCDWLLRLATSRLQSKLDGHTLTINKLLIFTKQWRTRKQKKILMKCLIICFRYFVVDGNFTEWGAWSKCSQTCENGTQVRFRSCTNPPPAFGGRDCMGPTNETRACNDGPCPGGFPVPSRFIVRASFLLLFSKGGGQREECCSFEK